MSRTKQAHPTTRPRTRKSLAIALSAALFSLIALGSTAAPAQAVTEDPLLSSVSCPDDATTPTWANNEAVRSAVYCLINKVRGKSNVQRLSFCGLHGTYCENWYPNRTAPVTCTTMPDRCDGLSVKQMTGLYIAAQWKSQDVMVCTQAETPSSLDATGKRVWDAHRACAYNGPQGYSYAIGGNRNNGAYDYWVRNPSVCTYQAPWPCLPWNWGSTPPPVSEVLTAGWPSMTARQAVDAWLHSSATVTGPGYTSCGRSECHREMLLKGSNWAIGVGVTPGSSNGIFIPYGTTGTVWAAYFSYT